MTKVSIIIPVYNSEKYLKPALDSVIGQDFEDFEAICVNDGSTDGSLEILRNYKKIDKRVKVIDQANAGGSAARNRALDVVIGDYIMFLDSDDTLAKGIVGRSYTRAVKTNADIVLYNFARFVGKPSFMAVRSRIKPESDIELFDKNTHGKRLFNDFATITWNKMIKKDLFDKTGVRFNEELSHNHDVDFSVRLMLAAERFSWIDDIGYFYRDNDTGLTATKRSDPTNVLKILIELNKLTVEESQGIKQSFDNYVADMIHGTLEKYKNSIDSQRQIFDYSRDTVLPTIGLDRMVQNYLFTESAGVIELIKQDNFDGFQNFSRSNIKILRSKLRAGYDRLQYALTKFIV